MGIPFAAGQRITAADLNTATQQGAWASYTPIWSTTGTAPSIGNGSVFGYYSKIGRTVSIRGSIYGGSTTTYGTGDYYVTLPFTAAVTGVPAGSFAHIGTWGLQQGSGAFYTAVAVILQSNPGSLIGITSGTSPFMGYGNPVNFAGAGAKLSWGITYESTS